MTVATMFLGMTEEEIYDTLRGNLKRQLAVRAENHIRLREFSPKFFGLDELGESLEALHQGFPRGRLGLSAAEIATIVLPELAEAGLPEEEHREWRRRYIAPLEAEEARLSKSGGKDGKGSGLLALGR